MTKYEALTAALKRAKKAAEAYRSSEDGGTCNFDSPCLTSWRGMKKSLVVDAIKAAGLDAWDWNFCGVHLVICGGTCGQGNRRSRMAEAMAKSLCDDGYDAGMYYQMD